MTSAKQMTSVGNPALIRQEYRRPRLRGPGRAPKFKNPSDSVKPRKLKGR